MKMPDAFYGGLGWSPAFEAAALSSDADERATALGLGHHLPEPPIEPQRSAERQQPEQEQT